MFVYGYMYSIFKTKLTTIASIFVDFGPLSKRFLSEIWTPSNEEKKRSYKQLSLYPNKGYNKTLVVGGAYEKRIYQLTSLRI